MGKKPSSGGASAASEGASPRENGAFATAPPGLEVVGLLPLALRPRLHAAAPPGLRCRFEAEPRQFTLPVKVWPPWSQRPVLGEMTYLNRLSTGSPESRAGSKRGMVRKDSSMP